MKRENLEKQLSKEEEWGFIKETGDPNYLGWILLSKRAVPPGTILDPKEGERYIRLKAEMEDRERRPYHLRVIELRRDTHESGVYETSDDYKSIENYYFSSLIEVENKLDEIGYSFTNIKFRGELDAP